MLTSAPCPDLDDYRLLISGQLAEAQAEELLCHLETCAACAGKIQTLPASDTLIEWIGQAKISTLGPQEKQLNPLIQHLIQLGKPTGRLTFSCSGCGKPLRVKAEAAGKKVKCPHCAQVMTAPKASGSGVSPVGSQTSASLDMETLGLPSPPNDASKADRSSPTPTLATAGLSSKERELCSFLAPSQAPDELGRLGTYRVLKVLGAGGMGVVFRAEDPQLQRMVAIKAMLPGLAENDGLRQRFLREARLAASLKHDHVVTIHQVGEDRGAPFLAMEFLEGESLEDRLKREGKLTLPEVLRIGREIAEGLQAAHERGLIHRDIKPGNIWLEGKRRRVKILDFGLARMNTDDVNLTQSGAIVGTPAYMPPEQARGEKVDSRCDLYSLGCVLYRLCTGELPFKADNTMSLLLALAITQPKSPREINPDVPPPLADLILRLLAKDLSQRPATGADVAQALQDIAAEKTVEKTVALPAATAPAPPRRRRKLVWVAAAGAFLIAALLTVIVIKLGSPEEGTVTIETVDPDVELVFTGGGRDYTVRDRKTGDEIKLPLGSYQVALKRGKDGLKLETNQFSLKRGGRPLVKVTWQASEKLAEARANFPLPVQVPEPPPLADWLKGRKVLTVAQDGSGQFKTIQAALDELKPHQVVKVLDRGPYRETLRLKTVPEDTGLISAQNTIVELPKWESDPKWTDADVGHNFEAVDGFRLSGFRFLAPPPKQYSYVTRWNACPSGLVIEDCCFDPQVRLDPWPIVQSIMLRYAGAHLIKGPVVVRRCAIYGGNLEILENHTRAVVLVENNYFHKTGTLYCGSNRLQKLIIRHNVFDHLGPHFHDLQGDATTLEMSNNTSIGLGAQCLSGVPTGGVTVCNNIMRYGFAFNPKGEAIRHQQAAQGWNISSNCYLEHGITQAAVVPKRATDVVDQAEFLSLNPQAPDYLRLPSDSSLGKAGAGGVWPSYIGALPPGPAPKDGDWFTRLRQRWDNAAPALTPLSPPVQVPEPPPLAEWLKGREMLTVSQDGRGQFKTIQAALNALQRGQAVKVLDRGPYRERLHMEDLPPDSGLISEHGTLLELSESKYIWTDPEVGDVFTGHLFQNVDGFRLSGFGLLFPEKRPEKAKIWQGLSIERCDGFVLENCWIRKPGPTGDYGDCVALKFRQGGHWNSKSIFVRECFFEGDLIIASAAEGARVVVERNFFLYPPQPQLHVQGPASYKALVIRHNVFGGPAGDRDIWITGIERADWFEISNNTLTSTSPSTICDHIPRGTGIVRNNLRNRPGLLGLRSGAEKDAAALGIWQVDHNAYPRQVFAEDLGWQKENFFPQSPTDILFPVKFLSTVLADRDYLRIPADSPLAKGGAGGAWPSYIGALPPGPAPKEGDWFTRLREQWLPDQPASKK